MTTSALELRAIHKRFGGVHALRGAELRAARGEILGLCGENGAGKSTLLKVLSGVYPHGSYEGEVLVGGTPRRFRGTADAVAAGVAIVHQELMLVPALTVAQNLFLGREPRRGPGLVDDDGMEQKARDLLHTFGVGGDIDAAEPVGELGIGLQQVVEIVRALSLNASVLVLDEPTAALTAREAARLMDWLRDLRQRGTTCIYVSHRMDEVFALCDRVTVLRDGKTEGTVVTRDTTPAAVVAMMVGRAVQGRARPDEAAVARVTAGATPVLEVDDLRLALPGEKLRAPDQRVALGGVSLRLRAGEVLGVCGAMGSGRTALLSTLFGQARGELAGQVRVNGQALAPRSARAAIDGGIAFLPEDRKGQGLVLGLSVADNLALPSLPRQARQGGVAALLGRLGFVDDLMLERQAQGPIASLRIRGTADVDVGTLSGGNQQKVALGKWLAEPPKVLLLDEPTRGVDVGAREEIYAILEELAARGVGILFASSDLPEVVRLAHRVMVLRHGRVVGELTGSGITEEEIVALGTGAAAPAPLLIAAPAAPPVVPSSPFPLEAFSS